MDSARKSSSFVKIDPKAQETEQTLSTLQVFQILDAKNIDLDVNKK